MLTNTVHNRRRKFLFTEPMLLLVAMFWGTSYGLTKEALTYTPILVFIILRFSITFILLLPVLIKDFRQGLNKDWQVTFPTGVILSAIFFCEVLGVSQTTASNAAFLISLSVIFTAFSERLINKKKISAWLTILSLGSIIGVFMLTRHSETSYTFNQGDYYILTAALLRAAMVTITKRLVDGKVITTSSLTALQSLVVALLSLLIATICQPSDEMRLPLALNFWFIILYLVVFCTLFAFYAQNHAVRQTSPTRVSLLMGSEPLFGAVFAVIWLQESLSIIQMIGGGMIMLCVITTSIKVKA